MQLVIFLTLGGSRKESLLFQSIFTWSAPAMDAVEAAIAWAADAVVPLIGNPVARDFTSDALFSGVGAFLVFVPQIFVLTFIIGLLEDSGYMARAALICHKPCGFSGSPVKALSHCYPAPPVRSPPSMPPAPSTPRASAC